MELIADFFLGAGALGAGLFCYVLSKRLKALNTLEGGMGGAIAVLSAQVDDMTRALQTARTAAGDSSRQLTDLTTRAEDSCRRLELLLASLHDLPEGQAPAMVGRRTRVIHHGAKARQSEEAVASFSSRRAHEEAA